MYFKLFLLKDLPYLHIKFSTELISLNVLSSPEN